MMTQPARTAARRRTVVRPAPLLVCPNPYAVLDHQGRPAGAARLDPDHSAKQRIYIGATLAEVVVLEERGRGARAAGLGPTLQVHFWEFETSQPTTIADTAYHRNLLEHRAVFAWDEATHRRIFRHRKDRPFVPPTEALAKSRQDAIDLWTAEHDNEAPIFLAEETEAAGEKTEPPQGSASAPAQILQVLSAAPAPKVAAPPPAAAEASGAPTDTSKASKA